MSKPTNSRHVGIDRDRVVECALSMVESGGPEALTMRKLAVELGVTPTTLYWHVGSRDEIITAIVERQGERQAAAEVQGDTPNERVMSAVRHVWDGAMENPELTRLAHASGVTSVLELGLEVSLALELQNAGLSGVEVRDALRSLLLCVGGFLVVGLRGPDAIPDARSSTALWAEVDDDRLDPAVGHAFQQTVDLPELFESTLRALVDHWVPQA